MMWQRLFQQWFVLVMVLVSVTSCELEQYGLSKALPEVKCQPGEWEYKGQCVPAGLPPDMPCPPGETLLDDGRCQPAGLPLDMQCPPGELALDNGKCQPAGVPPEMCGPGFEPDGKMGCNAILPAEACPFGLMAVPGETECHEVAPCGEGTWGDIPVDETTQFVNGAYAGNDSDGSKARPWRTIAKGIWEAEAGSIVAVAEGTYQENLFIKKQVKLWGVCPKKVTVTNDIPQSTTVAIVGVKASGAEIRNLAITGTSRGIDAFRANDVTIDSVWIHDTGEMGFYSIGASGPKSIILVDSLIERTRAHGLFTSGSSIALEKCVVRDTILFDNFGRGIEVQDSPDTGEPSSLTLLGSIIERIPHVGVFVGGSQLTVEATIVRDIGGGGMQILDNPTTAKRAYATIRTATVEHATGEGILVWNSNATIEASSIRGTQLDEHGRASAIHARNNANVQIFASKVEKNNMIGIAVLGSTASISASIIRDTLSDKTEEAGFGVLVAVLGEDPIVQSNVAISGSVIEHNSTGVKLQGSSLTMDGTVIREQQVHGLHSVDSGRRPGNAIVRRSLFEKNILDGLAIDNSDLTLETSIVRDTVAPDGDNEACGIAVVADIETGGAASATVRASVIERNQDIGVFAFQSTILIDASIIRNTQRQSAGVQGIGISSYASLTTIRASLVEENHHSGIEFGAADAIIEESIIRGTKLTENGPGGAGIALLEYDNSRTQLTVQRSIIDDNYGCGLFAAGAEVRVESTIISDTKPGKDFLSGRGIVIQGSETGNPSYAQILRSIVKNSQSFGVYLTNAGVSIESTIIRSTASATDGQFGDGITIISESGAAAATISGVQVSGSERANISNFGGNVHLDSSALLCGAFDMSTQAYDGNVGTFVDGGNNHCGCPDAVGACHMADVVLEPPPTQPPSDP